MPPEQQMRQILDRKDQTYALRGFDEAPDEVLRLFLDLVETPEFENRADLVPHVRAQLNQRLERRAQEMQQVSKETLHLTRKLDRKTLWLLWLTLLTLMAALLSWLRL